MADKADNVLEWLMVAFGVVFGMLHGAILWIFNREVKRIDSVEKSVNTLPLQIAETAKQDRHQSRNQMMEDYAELERRVSDLEKLSVRLEERIGKHQ